MARFDDVLDRATRRLRVDRELRLEVRRELAAHLDDTAAEYRSAGYGPRAADAEAVKALGDAEELSEKLWVANRFRVRLRAAAWWGARATLLPAAIGLTLMYLIAGWSTPAMYSTFDAGGPVSGPFGWAAQRFVDRLKSQMTADQRLIFYGDESATTHLEAQRGLRDAHPDEPLYQLNYIGVMLSHQGLAEQMEDRNPDAIKAVLHELDRGRKLDPDNGIYDMLEAAIWLREAGALVEDESRSVMRLRRDGERDESHPFVWTPEDDAALARGLAAFAAAADKPHLSAHRLDMLLHRVEQLPPARSLRDYVFRIGEGVQMLLPTLTYQRVMARRVAAEAIRRADAGDRDGALALLDQLRAVNQRAAAGARTLIGLVVADSIRMLELETRAHVHEALGDDDAAARAQADVDDHARQKTAFWSRDDPQETYEIERRAGMLLGVLMPAIPGYRVDVEAFRMAEYAMFDRLALGVLLVMLIGLALTTSTAGLWLTWRRRADGDRPVLLWVGWRRYAAVLGLGAAAPVLLFVVWTVLPWGGRSYGLNDNVALGSALAAYGAVWAATLVLIWLIGTAALQRRAAEIGFAALPPRQWTRVLTLTAIIIGLTAAGAAARSIGPTLGVAEEMWWSVLVIAVKAATVLAWGLFIMDEITWLKGRSDAFALAGRAASRGLGVAAGFIVVGAVVTPIMAPSVDWAVFILAIAGVGVVVGAGLGVLWSARQPGGSGAFAGSVVRSMGPVLAGAALLLAATAGPALDRVERAWVERIAARSPAWIDMEVEQSNGRVLRDVLRQDAAIPPRLPR